MYQTKKLTKILVFGNEPQDLMKYKSLLFHSSLISQSLKDSYFENYAYCGGVAILHIVGP